MVCVKKLVELYLLIFVFFVFCGFKFVWFFHFLGFWEHWKKSQRSSLLLLDLVTRRRRRSKICWPWPSFQELAMGKKYADFIMASLWKVNNSELFAIVWWSHHKAEEDDITGWEVSIRCFCCLWENTALCHKNECGRGTSIFSNKFSQKATNNWIRS